MAKRSSGTTPAISMSKGNQSLSQWMEQRALMEEGASGEGGLENVNSFSWMLPQISVIQESLNSSVNQLQELSGQLPDTAAFRQRVTHAVYLLCGSIFFGALAILVGLPTIVLKPSKFVICSTLSTLLGAGSVIVLQKPSVFISGLMSGGISKAFPAILLLISLLLTLYVTIFIHKYILIIAMGGFQVFCTLFYLASFIPGGTRGLQVLLYTGYHVINTALTPCCFVVKRTVTSITRQIMS